MREAALWHAAAGRPVFPVYFRAEPDGKVKKAPLTKHGFHDATLDPAQITKWWNTWPDAGIGMPCGPASGLMAIDYDVDEAVNVHNVREEFHERFDLPQTLLVASVRGGLHEYLRYAPDVGRLIHAIHPSVDILGEGGYVVLPPSRMGDGRAYKVIFDAEPCEATDSLLAAIREGKGQPNLKAIDGALTSDERRKDAELWSDLSEPHKWHVAQRTLISRYVFRGIDPQLLLQLAPAFRRAPYSHEQTVKEIGDSVRGAVRKFTPETAAAPKTTLKLWSIDELQSREPPSWVIGGMLPENAFACLYGESNTFKSFMALDMALAIAYGRDWHGQTVKQGAVIYVIGEGQTAFANRVRVWREAYGLQDVSAPFYAIMEPVQFGVATDVARLTEAVKAVGVKPDWTWVDTLARNFGPGDPDRTQDMQGFVAGCGAYQATIGGGLGVVHHAGKDPTKGARNSTVLKAAVDVEMRAEREENSPVIRLHTTKQKDAEQAPAVTLESRRIVAVDPRTGEEISSLVFALTEAKHAEPGRVVGKLEQRIVHRLSESPATAGAVADALREDKSNVRKALLKLYAKKVVGKTEDVGGVTFFIQQEQESS